MAQIFKPAAFTPSEKASAYREIAMRYRARFKGMQASKLSLPSVRIVELDRIFADRWGAILPPDDAGRDDAAIMVHHLVGLRNCLEMIMEWLHFRCPWMGEQEAVELVELAQRFPARWDAAELGKRLGLLYADRQRLRITTIRGLDVSLRQMNRLRKSRKVEAKRNSRRLSGVRPRHLYERWSLSKAKPWQSLGISRSTWYARHRTSLTPAIGKYIAGVRPVQNDGPVKVSLNVIV